MHELRGFASRFLSSDQKPCLFTHCRRTPCIPHSEQHIHMTLPLRHADSQLPHEVEHLHACHVCHRPGHPSVRSLVGDMVKAMGNAFDVGVSCALVPHTCYVCLD